MAVLTNRQDVISNFSKYLGRQPTAAEITKYMAQPPATLIKDLSTAKSKVESSSAKTPQTNQSNGVSVAQATPGLASAINASKPGLASAVTASKILGTNSTDTSSKITSAPAQPTNHQTTTPATPASTTTPFSPSAAGITDDLWKQLDPGTQAFVESVYKTTTSQYNSGMVNVSINQDLLNKAMANAATDPEIISKYGDAFNQTQQSLVQNLGQINAEFNQQAALTATQQQADKKAQAEQAAAAGQTYSGFRAQAQQKLQAEQSGVIESSRRQLQNQLNTLGSSVESQYGTAGLNKFAPITAGGLNYTPTGNITGTIGASQKADIQAKGLSTFNAEKL